LRWRWTTGSCRCRSRSLTRRAISSTRRWSRRRRRRLPPDAAAVSQRMTRRPPASPPQSSTGWSSCTGVCARVIFDRVLAVTSISYSSAQRSTLVCRADVCAAVITDAQRLGAATSQRHGSTRTQTSHGVFALPLWCLLVVCCCCCCCCFCCYCCRCCC
jgi:hypothetical protein